MKKMSEKIGCRKRNLDIGLSVLLCICTVSACYFYCMRYGMFGSRVDWINQHSVLPDYFRKQFYETGSLFPEFAANIGGGQNIYNFSYYGLYSPVVLVSYLFPFVKMSDYMMAAQLVSLAASIMLLYWWLVRQGFERYICFCISLVFLLSGPMVFHSHNQIMFVNYMPFLCMGFLGTDRYFEKGRSGLLTISVFLMIMTSFYFSIGGMLALGLYGLYRYLQEYKTKGNPSGKRCFFVKEAFGFCAAILIAVLMSGILLVPTAMALTGRGGSAERVDAVSLFVPELSTGRLFYSPYGIGLTTLAFTSLTAVMLFHAWQERILAWGCAVVLMVPVFAYLLNGGLYVRNKVMIPFLPLLCYIIACYMRRLESIAKKEDRATLLRGTAPYAFTVIIISVQFLRGDAQKNGKYLLADGILMLACYIVFCVRKNMLVLLFAPVLLLALSADGCNHQEDRQVSREFYKEVTDEKAVEELEKAVESEEAFYRAEQYGTEEEDAANLNRIWDAGQYVSTLYSSLYNEEYQRFREVFGVEQPFRNFLMQPSVRNPVFQRFMGVKYLACARNLYKNSAVSPVVYATDRVIEEKEYKKYLFPENQLSLLTCAVIKEKAKERQESGYESYTAYKSDKNLTAVKLSVPAEINSGQKEICSIDIPANIAVSEQDLDEGNTDSNKALFLRFHIENLRPSKDVAVWLEGQKNKLSSKNHIYYNGNTLFTYAVPIKEGQRQAKLVFGEGHYRISDTQCFLGGLPSQKDSEKLYQSKLILNKEKTQGNVIAGDISVKKDGYLITTIPYDKGFEIRIDGRNVKIEKVNTAFLGCKAGKGKHKAEIIYHAPGAKAGKAVSVLGVLLFLLEAALFRKFSVTAR